MTFQDLDLIRTRPVIIVANKIDLARSRAVSSQGKWKYSKSISNQIQNTWCLFCDRLADILNSSYLNNNNNQ